ncbi:MAG TPA: DUF4340 domain-containing protein [Candidatus Eisenbacteria bacterium]|nr:DUF4340 domain-containing protein [Candidatus Eisenbacteria bacterium]
MGQRTLVLSGLGFALLALLAWWLFGRNPAPEQAAFFTLKQRLPDSLTVISGGETTSVVPQGESGWEVVRPVRYPADGVLVNAMVRQLSELAVERRFPLTAQKMDSYGMRFPQGVLRAAYEDGREPDTLVIGNFTFDEAYAYVRNGSRPEVGLVAARTCRAFLLKRTEEIRDTQLLPFLESRVTRFATLGRSADTTMVLERQPDRSWRLSRPYPGPGAAKKVGEYLESLSHMHVDAFLMEGEAPSKPSVLQRPQAGVRILLEDGRTLGMDLGDAVPGMDLLYARTLARPHVFGVSKKYLPVLEWNPDRLRRPAVVDFGLKDVTTVTIGEGGRSRGLALADSLPRDVMDVLGNWLLLEARRFEPAARPQLSEAGFTGSEGSGDPMRTLTWSRGDTVLAEVRLGRPSDDDTPIFVPLGRSARPAEILYAPRDRVEPLFRALALAAGLP